METPPPRDRVPVLDVLRGVAILGTFASNAWLFADPAGPESYLLGGASGTGAVERGLLLLSNGKFLALLSLLFGIGVELQYRSALRHGRPWPGRYPWRAAVLFVEGLLHFVLVFAFDVLMGYALASLVVARLVGRPDRIVRRWIAAVGTVYVGLVLALTVLLAAVQRDQGGPGRATGPAPPTSPGDWLGQVAFRLDHALVLRIEILLIVPSAVVLFLVGSRLFRAGILADDERGERLRRRALWVGFGVAFPLNMLTTVSGATWVLVDRYLLPPVVAVGLLAMVTSLVHRSARRRRRRAGAAAQVGRVQRGLTAVGRTALSCYVLQNLLGAALCSAWGLGLAARLDVARPWWVVGLWATVAVVLAGLATVWTRRFPRGPLEMLARRVWFPGPGAPDPARPGAGADVTARSSPS